MKRSELKKLIKEAILTKKKVDKKLINRKSNLLNLVRDIETVQNKYESLLSDEDLDLLTNLISDINIKLKK